MNLESCSIYLRKPAKFEEGKEYYSTGTKRVPDEKSYKVLLAFDPGHRQIRLALSAVRDAAGYGGVMSTAAGLVFFADNQGFFEAADANQANRFGTSTPAKACTRPPMSYAVAGRQYVSIAAGSDLFSFALPATTGPLIQVSAAPTL